MRGRFPEETAPAGGTRRAADPPMEPHLDDEPPTLVYRALPRASIFRPEAVEARRTAGRPEDGLLRIDPAWARGLWALLVGAVAAAVVYVTLGTAWERAVGGAIVQSDGRTVATARDGGVVESVLVHPGQSVGRGDVIARLYAAEEAAELERVERELELQLVRRLLDPGDEVAAAALVGLRAQRDLAIARLEQRTIRAPAAGVVADVLVRPGWRVAAGDGVGAIETAPARFTVTALLPGGARPLLVPGMRLRLVLEGHPDVSHELVVAEVAGQVAGPAEVRRTLGPQAADALAVDAPVTIVRAGLASSEFIADGRRCRYHDGMVGRATVLLRELPLWALLVPGLREVLR